MYHLNINHQQKTPKYLKIVDSIIIDIENGVLKKNQQLPSLNELSSSSDLSRDTVEKAYRILKDRGVVTAVKGKGFYVNGLENHKIQILLILNKLSSYKKRIYYAFLEILQDKADVDLQIHHYNPYLFEEIIAENLGKYDYYVVVPIFGFQADESQIIKTLEKISNNKLMFLDKEFPRYQQNCPSVFQDFEWDVFNALEGCKTQLTKYKRLVLVFPSENNCPIEIIRGTRTFCSRYKKDFFVKEHLIDEKLEPDTIFLVIEDSDLADLIKKVRLSGLRLGEQIGIISFNDTTLKELLDITVISTDFEAMGKTAATMILNKQKDKIKNPFFMIQRGSL